MTTVGTRSEQQRQVEVWDPLVRAGHWLLVAGFAVAYLTEGKPQWLHSWAGYAIAAIVVLRLVWGIVGPRRARFADFVRGPRAVLGYLADLVRFKAPRHLGHSPAGGAMIVALLLSLAITTGTGMALLAIRENQGPLAPWLGQEKAAAAAPAQPGVRVPKPGRAVKEVHEFFANATLALIGLHLAGVLLASVAHRENLVRAMVTGCKRAPGGDEAART